MAAAAATVMFTWQPPVAAVSAAVSAVAAVKKQTVLRAVGERKQRKTDTIGS